MNSYDDAYLSLKESRALDHPPLLEAELAQVRIFWKSCLHPRLSTTSEDIAYMFFRFVKNVINAPLQIVRALQDEDEGFKVVVYRREHVSDRERVEQLRASTPGAASAGATRGPQEDASGEQEPREDGVDAASERGGTDASEDHDDVPHRLRHDLGFRDKGWMERFDAGLLKPGPVRSAVMFSGMVEMTQAMSGHLAVLTYAEDLRTVPAE